MKSTYIHIFKKGIVGKCIYSDEDAIKAFFYKNGKDVKPSELEGSYDGFAEEMLNWGNWTMQREWDKKLFNYE